MNPPAMNPYLPLTAYIPDGEPRVFDGRLYVYGSHDLAGGEKGFCPGDYEVWSAPVDDLGRWTCHGVSLARSAVPGMTEGDAMAAPDVVRGPDGRYYLYFNTNAQKVCRVGVSETPTGPFELIGEVRLPDGTPYEGYKMFDPGVLVDDDGRVYLYVGFCIPVMPVPERFTGRASPFAPTSLGFELESDMMTIRRGPVPILPGAGTAAGTGFENHAFYEASSPRKIEGRYVMVYSTEQSHELAYALADTPFGPYCYAGVLVSNADLGLAGNIHPVMPYGNNHGGLVELGGDWYIFYHRQTSGQEASRQGCAEKLPRRSDGWFGQAEITSCGLNGGPLPACGSYPAACCCRLTSPDIRSKRYTIRDCRRAVEPHIYEEPCGRQPCPYPCFIANIGPGTVVGYKYFAYDRPGRLTLTLRGEGHFSAAIHADDPDGLCLGRCTGALAGSWQDFGLELVPLDGTHALYIRFETTEGRLQFAAFAFAP